MMYGSLRSNRIGARCGGASLLIAASGMLPSLDVHAQVLIGPEVRVDAANPNSGVEPSVGIAIPQASETMEAMAAGMEWQTLNPRVGFGITFDGGLSWEHGLVDLQGIPPTLENTLDPTFWTDRSNGDVWMVLMGTNPAGFGSRIYSVTRAPGVHASAVPQALLRTPASNNNGDHHLPRMTAGPAPGETLQRNLYILFQQKADEFLGCQGTMLQFCGGTDDQHMMLARSTDSGVSWTVHSIKPSNCPPSGFYQYCEYQGYPTGLAVIDRGPWKGTVIALGQGYKSNETPPTEYYAVWSTDAGQTWPLYEERKLFFPSNLQVVEAASGSDPVSELAGNFRNPLFTAADVDPTTGDLFIVVSGKKVPGSTAQGRNLDLYIVRGRTTTPASPIVFDPPVPLNLDPNGYALMDGPDQFMPAIAIDDLGGINLLYYDTRHQHVGDATSYIKADAYYARVTGFQSGSPQVVKHRLTSPTFASECQYNPTPAPCPYEEDPSEPVTAEFIGDYQGIDAIGCDVYVTYMSTLPANKRHYFARRINVCAADADSNLVVNEGDPGAFLEQYSQGKLGADLNQDGQVSQEDVLLFTDVFLNAPK